MEKPSDFLNLFKPIIQKWWIITICIVLSLFIAYKIHLYKILLYKATATIKLNNSKIGSSTGFDSYQLADIFQHTNKTANEVALLESDLMIKKTLGKLDFDVTYFRIGNFVTSELYHRSPFMIKSYHILDSTIVDIPIFLESEDGKSFNLIYTIKGKNFSYECGFNKKLNLKHIELEIKKNNKYLDAKRNIDGNLLKGKFKFQINSMEALSNNFSLKNFYTIVKNKDVDVVSVCYIDEVPEKAQAFVNTLADTYINDVQDFKEMSAKKAVSFIKKELDIYEEKLRESETALENYKLQNKIIDPEQETDANLKKVNQFEMQLVTLKLKEAALEKVYTSLEKDEPIYDIAPNYESLLDPLFNERLKNLNNLKLERETMLIKYKKYNDKIVAIDKKVKKLKNYIIESIQNTKQSLKQEEALLNNTIDNIMVELHKTPSKEKNLLDYEREFRLNDKIYSFLAEKKIEAELTASTGTAFHRVIEYADLPKKSVSAGRFFTLALSAFIGLFIGLGIVYGIDYLNPVVASREELEKQTSLPVVSVLKRFDKHDEHLDDAFYTMAMNLEILKKIQGPIAISSGISGEGKSYIAYHLARTFAQMGWATLLVDFDTRNPSLHKHFKLKNKLGIAEYLLGECKKEDIIHETNISNLDFVGVGQYENAKKAVISYSKKIRNLAELQGDYDLLIFDTSPVGITIEPLILMKHVGLNLYVVKAENTRRDLIHNIDLLKEEYDLDNINIVLNSSLQNTSYNGYFIGKGYDAYTYKKSKKDKFGKVRLMVDRLFKQAS